MKKIMRDEMYQGACNLITFDLQIELPCFSPAIAFFPIEAMPASINSYL